MVRAFSTKVGFCAFWKETVQPRRAFGFNGCMVMWDRYFYVCGTFIGALHVIVTPAVSGRARTAIRHVKFD